MAVKINFDTYLFISPQKISIYVNEKQSLKKLYHEELFNSDKKKEFLDQFVQKSL